MSGAFFQVPFPFPSDRYLFSFRPAPVQHMAACQHLREMLSVQFSIPLVFLTRLIMVDPWPNFPLARVLTQDSRKFSLKFFAVRFF